MKVFSSAFFVMAIQSVRCDGMRLMLLAENCSIRQAAEACGFSNRAHFYRMYSCLLYTSGEGELEAAGAEYIAENVEDLGLFLLEGKM